MQECVCVCLCVCVCACVGSVTEYGVILVAMKSPQLL